MTRQGLQHLMRRGLVFLLSLAAIVAVWQMCVTGLRLPPYLVPAPGAVLGALAEHAGVIGRHSGFTLGAAALGLSLSIVLATVMAVVFSMNRSLEQASMPLVIALRSTPIAATAPITMLVFGRGVATSMVVVTVVSFFPLLVNLMRGLAQADRNAGDLLYVYGASRWQQLRYVRIPYAMPYLFTGLRVAGSSAILGAMLSEWITGSKGLGQLILDAGEMRETELLWAAVGISVMTALAIFWLTSAGERRVVHWRN